MPNKKKWKPFNLYELDEADKGLMPDSTPSRTASNPIFSAQYSRPDRRIVSERAPPRYLDEPLSAAGLQKLHESQERERSAATLNLQSTGPSGETSKSPTVSALLTSSHFEQPPEPTLRTTTNCQFAIAKPEPPVERDEAAAELGLSCRDRSDSTEPLSNKTLLARHQCSSSSPDREVQSGASTFGDDMASAPIRVSGRPNRFENRPPMSTILCRNGPQCRKLQEGMASHIDIKIYLHSPGNL